MTNLTEEKIYEATVNVHVPSLKCSYFAGTRFLVKNGIVTAGFQETPLGNDFMLLIRNGILRELSGKEANTPEQITQPKVIKVPERKKMKVEIQDEPITILTKKIDTPHAISKTASQQEENSERTVRGMKVITTQTTDIPVRTQNDSSMTKAISGKALTSKPKVSPEKLKEVEARKKARLESLERARKVWSEKAAKARQEKDSTSTNE